MSYLGWCYTKPKLDAASPPEYSGPRARARLGALYNALIYRQLEEERSAVELSGGLIVEFVRFHHRDDTHGRAMTGCLLLLFSAETSSEAREATLRELRALIFSEDSHPELTDEARAYEASRDETSDDPRLTQPLPLSSLGSSSAHATRSLLIGFATLLLGVGAWSLSRSLQSDDPERSSHGGAVTGTVTGTGTTHSSAGGASSSVNPSALNRESTSSETRDARALTPQAHQQKLTGSPHDLSRATDAEGPLQVHQITALEGCVAAYQRAASERAAWSAWTRASLSRRCQALATRAARGDLRALKSSSDSPQTPQELCQRRLAQLQELARHQELPRDPALDQLETRCAAVRGSSTD